MTKKEFRKKALECQSLLIEMAEYSPTFTMGFVAEAQFILERDFWRDLIKIWVKAQKAEGENSDKE